jgi:hypothetical protein
MTTMRRTAAQGLLAVALLAACTPDPAEETNLARNARSDGDDGAGGAAAGGGAGSGGEGPGAGGAGGAAGQGGPGGGTAGPGGGPAEGSVGSACSADSDCKGYDKPTCLTELKPLKGKITDPTHPQADKFENELVMPFPGGYCATSIADSCANDAACGPGGGCFRGLDGVKKDDLAMLDMSKTGDGLHPFLPFSTVEFADVGICLKPCTTAAECRDGYVCEVPMGTLIGAINDKYTRTFCVGPFTFML